MHRAILFNDVDTPILTSLSLPNLKPNEVLIETAYSCISPGTELRCLAGKQADLSFPFIPGYSLSGRVAAVGSAVNSIQIGDLVFATGTAQANHPLAWGGHVSHAIQPQEAVFPLPSGVDLLAASITHIAAISYHGMRLSRPQAHENVLVIGLGIIGQCAARLHALSGAHVLGVDLSSDRVVQLQDLGIDAVTGIEQVRDVFPSGVDIIVDATGVPKVIPQAIELARDLPWDDTLAVGTRYLVQGSYAQEFGIPYQTAFLKEVSFWIPRDAQPRDFRRVLDFMARGKLPLQDLIGEVAIPDDAPRIYAALHNNEMVTAAFDWELK